MRGVQVPVTDQPPSSPREAQLPAGSELPVQPVRHRRGRRFLSRAPIAVCAAVLFALCISYITLLRSGAVHIQQSDVLVYYSASHLVLAGHGSAIYSFPALKAVESSTLHSGLTVRNQAAFLYPPFVALALAPLAAVGYSSAYLLWFILNCLLLVGVLVALQRYLQLRRSGSVLLVVAGASFFPVFATLAQGQVSMLLLAVLTASFLALRAQRDGWAGALLALALIKPPYVLPFLLLLLVQGRWRALASFCAAGAALALLPMAVLGPSINQGTSRCSARRPAGIRPRAGSRRKPTRIWPDSSSCCSRRRSPPYSNGPLAWRRSPRWPSSPIGAGGWTCRLRSPR